MTPEQKSLLIEFICIFIAVAPSIASIITLARNNRKDKEESENRENGRFKSLEETMIKLTSSIDMLNQRIQQMNKDIEKTEHDETELSKRVQSHDVKLADHEARLTHLEEDK